MSFRLVPNSVSWGISVVATVFNLFLFCRPIPNGEQRLIYLFLQILLKYTDSLKV